MHLPCSRLFPRRLWFAGILLVCATIAPAAETGVRRGEIVDSVACLADPKQQYALYLPPTYTHQQTWPVIFCFDPRARGRLALERLRPAAERYGYILAGSLNSKNGSWDDSMAAADAMMKDVAARLHIDVRRLYAAGFSGGARVASAVGMAHIAKGVIACGAGFPTADESVPPGVDFPLFGTAGVEDFNYSEMIRIDGELDRTAAPHRLRIHPGPHDWAPSDVLIEALEWLELQAMRSGSRPRDDAFIAAQLKARSAALEGTAGLDRWRAVKSLADDFRGLAEVTTWANEAAELGRSKEIKDAVKAERALLAREAKLADEIIGVSRKKLSTSQKTWIADLRRQSDAAADDAERQMIRRAIALFFMDEYDTVRTALADRDYAKAVRSLETAIEFRPKSAQLRFELADALALRGDSAAALQSLEAAVEAGYRNSAKLTTAAGLKTLAADPRFQTALAKVRANEAAKAATTKE